MSPTGVFESASALPRTAFVLTRNRKPDTVTSPESVGPRVYTHAAVQESLRINDTNILKDALLVGGLASVINSIRFILGMSTEMGLCIKRGNRHE